LRYPKELVLKDGNEALIRPLEKEDEPGLRQFYADIPADDLWYMRYDVRDPNVIRKWIDSIGKGTVYSTIALSGIPIVAHASLHMRGFGSTRHVGRLRIVVTQQFRHKRLGTWMLLDLIQLAMDKGLQDVRADFVVDVEDAAIEAAYKLDFFEKAVLKDYVKDPQGNRHDMLIMMKRLHKGWGDF
jgi:L-amino acid N-acyltransferase YncA